MAKAKVVTEAEQHVTLHLDVDPNDARNREPAGKLPSLNDEDQN